MKTRILTTTLALCAAALLLLAAVPAADAQFCPQVITFAQNPETGECEAFPTPCDVPDGWEECSGPSVPMSQEQPVEDVQPESDLPLDVTGSAEEMQQNCIQVITYGKNPGTGECEQFATPCDVPRGWEQFSTLEDCQASTS